MSASDVVGCALVVAFLLYGMWLAWPGCESDDDEAHDGPGERGIG